MGDGYREALFGLPIRGARGLMVPLKGNDPAMFQFMDKAPYYWTILIGLIILLYATHRLRKARAGYYMLAVRGDEDAAAATGISILRTKAAGQYCKRILYGFGRSLLCPIDPVCRSSPGFRH